MIIDISQHNTIKNWDQVKNAVDGVIIRMGYTGYSSGAKVYDKKFMNNMEAVKIRDIPYGAYYFPASINRIEAEAEADFIAETIKSLSLMPALGVWLDSEIADVKTKKGRADNLSREKRTEFLHIIIGRLHDRGIDAGVYASTDWLYHQLNMEMLPGVPVWVAQYNTSQSCTYKGEYILHQYTSKGAIMGISGNVDLNKLHITDAPVYVPEMVKDTDLFEAVDVIAQRVIRGEFGEGHEQRKEKIYKLIRQRVNDILK
mgnify:CR=1 FL=1